METEITTQKSKGRGRHLLCTLTLTAKPRLLYDPPRRRKFNAIAPAGEKENPYDFKRKALLKAGVREGRAVGKMKKKAVILTGSEEGWGQV